MSDTLSLIRTYSPYVLGDRKKVQAGITDIQTNIIRHVIIERFLICQEPFVKFTYQDIKDSLDREFSPREFYLANLRINMTFLLNHAFPYKLVKETYYQKGRRGRFTQFFLTARIKKIKNNGEMSK